MYWDEEPKKSMKEIGGMAGGIENPEMENRMKRKQIKIKIIIFFK